MMHNDDFMNSKIIYINEEIIEGFFGIKFNDTIIEQEYIEENKFNNNLVEIILHFTFIFLFLFKNYFVKTNEILYIINIIASTIYFFLIVFYYSFKNSKHKIILEKLNGLIMIFFLVENIILNIFFYENPNNHNIIRSSYNMYIGTFIQIIITFESNIFFTIFIFIINFIVSLIVYFNFPNNERRIDELLMCIMTIIFSYLLKRYYSYLLRNNFIKIYKLKKYVEYANDLLNSMNGYHFSIRKNKILFFNKNFSNFLKNLKINYSFKKIEHKKILIQKNFSKNIFNNERKNLISVSDNSVENLENKCKSANFREITNYTISENTQFLTNQINLKNKINFENLINNNNNNSTKIIENYRNQENELSKNKMNSDRINYNSKESIKILHLENLKNKKNESFKFNQTLNNLNKTDFALINKESYSQVIKNSEEKENFIFNKILISFKLKSLEKDFQDIYEGHNLFEIINNLNNKNLFEYLNDEKKNHKFLDVKYNENPKEFQLLGEFICEYDEKNYQIYFRKLGNCNNIIDFILYEIKKIKEEEKIKIESKLKNLFFSKIAHEFKTPLSCILSIIHNLKNNYSENKDEYFILDKNIKFINQIENLSNYIVFLLNDIIEYSKNSLSRINLKIKQESIEISNIFNFCKEISDTILETKGKEKILKIKINLDEYDRINSSFMKENKIIKIQSDVFRLKQILLNFLSNSIKFTKSGIITMIAKYEKINEKYTLILSVKDTGIGIKPEDLKNLFKDTISLDYNKDYNKYGSCLGLSITKYLTNQLNHKIRVNSDFGYGSEFSIIIDSINVEISPILKYPSNKNLTIISNEFIHKIVPYIINDSDSISDVTTPINDFSKMRIDLNCKKLLRKSDNNIHKNTEDVISNRSNNFMEVDKNFKKISFKNFYSQEKMSGKSSDISSNNSNFLPNIKNTIRVNSNKNEINKYNINIKCQNNQEINFKIINPDKLINFNSKIKKYKKKGSNNFSILTINNESFSDSNLNASKIIGKKKILIIDDHKFIRNNLRNLIVKYLKKKLLFDEFEIIEGSDGVDILYQVIYDQSNNNLIKCIFTDENMEYFNGSEAIELIKKFEKRNKIKKIPIAFVTAFEDDYLVNLMYDSGADIVLQKPCSESAIICFIEKYNILNS